MLIEGVGDEVVQFVAVILLGMVAALAWWSTNARPDRYRTVVVMRSRSPHPVTLSIRTRTRTSLMPSSLPAALANMQPSTSDTVSGSEVVEENARVIPLQEMDSIVDADMAMLDNNRLHFYRRIDSPNTALSAAESTSDESEVQEEVEPASNAQIREMDSIVSAMEADVTAGCDFFTRTNEPNATAVKPTREQKDNSNNETNPTSNANAIETNTDSTESSDVTANTDDAQRILIKLKYLNDTLKEVEGSLDEQLKDFKWRHFSTELTAESRVRLIFNGRVLGDEAATLRACGLHHRAVVHCLVHPKRPVPVVQSGAGADSEPPPPRRPERAAWDLENILMTLVSVALTVVWFFRCEYSNMFTASASVALFGLTVFYSVAIFGLYLSDTFQFDRRAPQPVPNN